MDRINAAARRRFHLQVVALVVIVLGYVAHFRLLDARIQDDAFISFRYARHFAAGQGLVWNAGEYVEGYTNFLWTLLMALPLAISNHLNPMSFARALSSFSGYATIILSFLLVRHLLPKSRVLPLVPAVLLAGSWPLAINTMTGLETVFFGALLTGATFLLLREQDDLRYQGSSCVFALAALTRPEAILLFLLTFLLVAGHRRKDGKPGKDYLLRLGLPFAAIVGAHIVFRLAYYGEFVPNTYFVKFGTDLPAGMPTRAIYVGDFLTKGLDPLGLTVILALIFALLERRQLRAQILVLGAFFGLVNIALSGADFMIGYRYLVPYGPAFYICATLGVHAFIDRFRKKPIARKLEWAFLFSSLVIGAFGYRYSQEKLRPFERLRYLVNSDTNTALGKWLADTLPKDAVVVARDIGEIGYLSDLPLVDMTGLTDRTISRKPGNVLDRALDVNDIFNRNPSAFVFVSKMPGPVTGPRRSVAYSSPQATLALLDDPRMQEQFVFFDRYPKYDRLRKSDDGQWRPVSRAETQASDFANTYFLEVYLRKDLANSLPK